MKQINILQPGIGIESVSGIFKNPKNIILVDRTPSLINVVDETIVLLAHKEYNLSNLASQISDHTYLMDQLGVYVSAKMVLPIGIRPLYIEPENFGYYTKIIDNTIPYQYYINEEDNVPTKQVFEKTNLNIYIDMNLARYLNKQKQLDSLVIRQHTPVLKLDFLKCYNHKQDIDDVFIIIDNYVYENFIEFL